jgi:hypothetical protein
MFWKYFKYIIRHKYYVAIENGQAAMAIRGKFLQYGRQFIISGEEIM